MRRMIALMMALLLALGCAACAEAPAVEMMTLDFGDFTMDVRADAIGTTAETIENNVPFMMIFEDYEEGADFNKNLNCVWTDEVMDLNAVDPDMYVQYMVAMTMQEFNAMGVAASEPMLYAAGLDRHDGKDAISYVYSLNLDYSGIGIDSCMTLYYIQAAVPIDGSGTYFFTITTDDLSTCEELMAAMESIRWKQ